MFSKCVVSVFMCMFLEGVCVKCLLYVLNRRRCIVCVLCVLRQPAERGGTSAHSGTGLLPLHTAPAEQRFTA